MVPICNREGCRHPLAPSLGVKPRRFCSRSCARKATDASYREKNREARRIYERERSKRLHADPVKRQQVYDRHNARTKALRAEGRMQPKVRGWQLRRRLRWYGLTDEQYLELEAAGCAICGGNDGEQRLCFDHDHDLGHTPEGFRGLLCSRCNKALGLLGDSLDGVEAAADYLRAHRRVHSTR